uniref:Uncharacterized protein n=1 Tax=Glossina brevipalpis TaxID=37001 RepID=A0A1A9WW13_9MUSC
MNENLGSAIESTNVSYFSTSIRVIDKLPSTPRWANVTGNAIMDSEEIIDRLLSRFPTFLTQITLRMIKTLDGYIHVVAQIDGTELTHDPAFYWYRNKFGMQSTMTLVCEAVLFNIFLFALVMTYYLPQFTTKSFLRQCLAQPIELNNWKD